MDDGSNHDSNETILETLSISEKALKMLMSIFGNVNAAMPQHVERAKFPHTQKYRYLDKLTV